MQEQIQNTGQCRYVDPMDRVDVLSRENAKFVQEYWLSSGNNIEEMRQNGREYLYKLPTGEIMISPVDWPNRAPHRYETYN